MNNKIIEIRNLDYSYPDRTRALNNVSLDIFRGESVGIIGPNGAGKSTFLLHMNGVLNGNGSVRIFGLKPEEKNLAGIRRKVGLVFQDSDDQLFMPTVFDDVAFGPLNLDMNEREVRRSVDEALKRVDMMAFVDKTPHHLSVGEKRRVSIATALSMGPELLLLDEPSSNLDPHTRRNLINFLREFEITKIIASHDLDLVLNVCKRVVLLNKGEIIADGDAREILRDKPLLESHKLEAPPSLG